MRRGSITVFLALMLTALLTLSLVLSESARYGGIRYKVHSAGNIAMDSLFAGFDRELLEEYGLMFLEGGYGKGLLQEEELTEEFLKYFEANTPTVSLLGGSFFRLNGTDAVVTDIVTATDYRGEIFIRSVLDYYKYEGAVNLVSELTEKTQEVSRGEEAKEENERVITKGETEELKEKKTSDKDGERKTVSEEEYNKMVESSPIGVSKKLRRKGWIQMVIPKGRTISAYRMDSGDYPSLTAVDDRKLSNESVMEKAVEKAVFNEYLLRHFSCFTDTEERAGVQYELEYILYGETTDEANLRKVLNRLLLIREGLNIAHIESSPAKKEAVLAMATALTGWTGLAPVVALTEAAIAGAWAFAESLIDLRDLLSGYSVPLTKTDKEWNLGLGEVCDFLRSGGKNGKKNKRGETYEGYLRLLLYLDNFRDSAYRAMDMVQDRRRESDANFLMASQIYALTIRLDAGANQLFTRLRAVRREYPLWGWVPYSVRDYFSEVY